METEYLREYVVFSQQLNYAKAADALFLSQPTLRAHIKALEDEIGASLTIKRDNQFVLSPAGKFFLKKARDIIKLTGEATETSRTIAENSASLIVGFLEYPYLEDLFIKARELLPEQSPTRVFVPTRSFVTHRTKLRRGHLRARAQRTTLLHPQ